jgi:hypothetical protein
MVGASGITAVAAIDALANYFKHRDEWPYKWKDFNKNQKVTATILKDLGVLRVIIIKEDGKDLEVIERALDFRDGFQLVVGSGDLDRLAELKAILDGWCDELVKGYKYELTILNLLH